MKLDAKSFKRYLSLKKLVETKKASKKEEAEFKKLQALKLSGSSDGNGFKGKGGRNDVSWWNKYPQLFKDVTNIPFNYIKGTPLFTGNYSYITTPDTMPSIVHGMRIDYLRTVGKCVTANDSFNYQMRKLWLAMHHKYRGLGTYEFADLGIAIFAIICAFSDLARAERIYGLFNNYKILNRTIPEGIFSALEVESVPVTGSEIANYRYELNRIVQKAKTLCLPSGISILESFLVLDGNVFKDSDSNRATWFVYDTPYYCEYDPTAATGGRVLYQKRTKTNGNSQSLSDIVLDLNTIFDALLLDTDIARMCSDMLAAIGDAGLVTLQDVPEDYRVDPIRDDSRLLQLHNTRLVGNVGSQDVPAALARPTSSPVVPGETLQIYQNNGSVVCNFSAVDTVYAEITGVDQNRVYYGSAGNTTASSTSPIGDILIDIWKDDVAPEDIMEMTRQTVIFNTNRLHTASIDVAWKAMHSYGNILCMTMQLFELSGGEEGVTPPVVGSSGKFNSIVIDTATPSAVYSVLSVIGNLSQIDWHPILYLYSSNHSALGTTFNKQKHYLADLDNCVKISSANLTALHDVALLSGWTIPFTESVQAE